METLTSRVIHDIIVNECSLSLSSTSGRLVTIGIFTFPLFTTRYTFFFRRDFFHVFFLTVNISTLHQFVEPSHPNFFSHLITYMVVTRKLVFRDYENFLTRLISKV